jgi:hypothetical protein
MAKFVQIVATKIGGADQTPARTQWLESSKIDDLEIGTANGAAFRYTRSDASVATEYRTSTAASTIAAAANA